MKLIVGLGNPGSQYDRSRHNAGYLVLDRLAARHAAGVRARAQFKGATLDASIAGEKCLLLKPTTYMNRSGQSVGEAVRFYKLEPAEDLLVVVDDVALPAGVIRLRPEGGAGGHNGLADIEQALAGGVYPRLRIGIDPVPSFMDQADYVLGRFTDEQMMLLEPALDRAMQAVEAFVGEGTNAAMNKFNERIKPSKRDDTGGPKSPQDDGGGRQAPPSGPTHPGWLGGSGN